MTRNEPPKAVYRTPLGVAYQGDSRALLASRQVRPRSIDLIMTSPPFALTRPKDYGNAAAAEYVDWFMGFVAGFKRVLKDTGSIVIDIGGSYLRGRPVRSTYHFELAVRLSRELDLCQEFYWYNPAKLPSPAEWVTVRRIRVKDSVNPVFWFSKNATATKADNRRVLKRYSEAMETLLRNGYQYRQRPSGHDISDKFVRRHGGAIPANLLGSDDAGDVDAFTAQFPNLLAIANTGSNTRYQRLCREHGIKPHPARFPIGLPSFFIEFLTEPGDLVLDPFAGSNVTGEAAERLGRRWIACDLDREGDLQGTYVRSSAFRFTEVTQTKAFAANPRGNYAPKTRLAAGGRAT